MKIWKIFLLPIIALFVSIGLSAQTDREFWFVAPEITSGHCGNIPPNSCPGGEPTYLQISCLNLSATVTISMPAEPAFVPIVFAMAANTSQRVNMTPFVNLIENRPSDQVLNKGILIESTQLITAYYDDDEYFNPDLFALKGSNALGTDFYTPFQTHWRNGAYAPAPRCAIDIVATQNNTQVTITPKAAVDGHAAGVPYTITLNRGQTYSCRAVGNSAAAHLGGSHVTSTKPIAVTISDDSVDAWNEGGCRDMVGDQTVPINLIGHTYIVMKGRLLISEFAFILATQNGTDIYINGNPIPLTTLNTGQIYEYLLTTNSVHIRGSKPIYILHVAGFGCEMGGAVLPTIDGCTGSSDVSFTRSTSQGFFLNLMIKNGPQISAFWLQYENGTTFNIPAGWFEPVGTTGWVVLRDVNKQFADGLAGGVPTGQVTRVYNTLDVFHLGLINGGPGTGCKYGYFSDYTVETGTAEISNTHTDFIQTCYGDSIQLLAAGGVSYAWDTKPRGGEWLIYLNDTSIANPKVFLPPGSYKYQVDVERPCLGDTTMEIVINIFEKINASFSIDKSQDCSPLTVTINDQSVGTDIDKYRWKFGDGSPNNLTNSPPPHTYINTSDTAQTYQIELLVKNYADCSDTMRQNVIVFPFINADFSQNVTTGCNPLGVQFVNNTTGGTLDSAIYKWNFGDSGSSFDSIPYHVFQNNGTTDSVYLTTFVAKSKFNCTDTLKRSFTVHSFIDAVYSIDKTMGCSPLTVNINTTLYGGITNYNWNFGDGTVFIGPNPPPKTYINTSGVTDTLYLRLIVKNAGNCTDTLIRQIIVYSEVSAGFTPSATTACTPKNITFTDNSSAWVADYNWDFGDGASSGVASPAHLFENPGTIDSVYTTQLVVTTANGCTDSHTQNITIYPYIQADFAVEDATGCAPFKITIDNQSEGGISQYRWNFGDTQTRTTSSFEATVIHTYQNTSGVIQNRNLRLVVDNGHCTDTLIRQITVYPQVTAGFNMSTASGCHPLQVVFTNTSTVPAPATYNWDFGDGGSSINVNPLHLFSNFGNTDTVCTTRLIASSEYNCADTITKNINVYHTAESKFTIDKTFDCPPLKVNLTNNSEGADSYQWVFGDGGTSSLTDPVHTYDNLTNIVQVRNLRLYAKTLHGCNDTTGIMVSVFPRVTADYTYTSAGCHPFVASFTNTSQNATVYFWDFGDGITSGTQNPSNRFVNTSPTDINYSVRLIAKSDYNCIDTVIKSVTVYPSPEAEFFVSPVAQVYYDPSADVNFQNKTNHLATWNYRWEFGDDKTSTTKDASFSHSYEKWGLTDEFVYSISLRAYSAHCSDEVEHNIFITPPLPEIDIVDEDPHGCAPLTVYFSVTSSYAESYQWDFDDGTTSTEKEPVHTFESPGTYYVALEVEGDGGSDFDFQQVIVENDPVADFSISSPIVPGVPEDYYPKIYYLTEDTLKCSSESQYGETYLWNFGDGNTMEGEEVEHIYTDMGIYDISLLVTTKYGCTDLKEIKQAIEVKGKGKIDMPNAFSPYSRDGKNLNDKFRPLRTHEGIIEYHLYIYNRWGELLFDSFDPDEGWDGTYKGKIMTQDVYIWKVKAKFTDGTKKEFAGDVTLLR